MEYINKFNENINEDDYATSDNLKSYFKDKINWKLFNYISDYITRYTDKGITTTVDVAIKTHAGTLLFVMFKNQYIDGVFQRDGTFQCDRDGWISDADNVEMLYIYQAYKFYGITYIVEIEERIFQRIYRELIEIFKKKFNIEVVLDKKGLDIREILAK